MSDLLRVFLDSNVLFSAAYSEFNPFQLFWILPGVEILTSQYSIGEVSSHLVAPAQRARLWNLIYRSHLVPEGEDPGQSLTHLLPEKDLPILLAAIAGGAHVLVTGDRNHFGPLFGKSIQRTRIESPSVFKNRYPEFFKPHSA